MTHIRQPDPLAFGATSGRDADDYYNFLSSSSDSDDEEDTKAVDNDEGGSRAIEDVVELTSVPLDVSAGRVPSAVFTRLSGPRSSRSRSSESSRAQQAPSQQRDPELLARVAAGAVSLAGGDRELRVAPESLAQHATRKSQLASALDALSLTTGASSNSTTGVVALGEAPFRFRPQAVSEDVEMTGAEPEPSRVGPDASSAGDRTQSKPLDGSDSADPLYDDGLDDADEKWVQRNFRGDGPSETDATLCCPCCFMTVCLDCQRHATYATQYRASAAVNCRVKKDEILTYASGAASASSLPFHKRLNVAAAARTSASGASLSLLSSANEFYPVVCSDCGTTVGVLDRQQHYHFFNVLPSNS